MQATNEEENRVTPMFETPMKDDGLFRARSTFTLRLRVLTGDVPGRLRVRQFLKAALRAYGIKSEGFCENIQPDAGEAKPEAANGT